jgi:hypothetical protein
VALTTYAELQAAVADWMARSDLTTVIPADFIVMFEARANRVLRVRQMLTSTNLTPSSGSATLPTDYLEWQRVTWTGSQRRELEYVLPTYLQAAYPTSPADLPTVFTIEGTTLKIRPVDGTVLEFLYYQKIPALSAGNQATHWLFTAHPDLYLAGALYAGRTYMKDMEMAEAWKGEMAAIFDEIRRLSAVTQGQTRIRAYGSTP